MKARNLGLAVSAMVALLLIGQITRIFLHQEKPVNYAQNIDSLKARGIPEFSLYRVTTHPYPPRISNENLKLENLKAQITIVNFWASWCAPCIKEMPSLMALSKKYSKDPRLEIIGISEDKDTKQLFAYLGKILDQFGSVEENFKFLWDGNFDVAYRFGSQKIPETYIIDKDHKLIRKVIDEQNWMSQDFLKWLDSLLSGAEA